MLRYGFVSAKQLHRLFPCLAIGVSLLVLGATVGPSSSWAWGDLGHKIHCQIAFEELNSKARAAASS